MKIELTYDGKNYYDPLFLLFWNEQKNDFCIGIKHNERRNYQFILDDINSNFEKYTLNLTSFCYYTKENVYVFDFKHQYDLLPKNKKFEHSIVLLDKNDKIIEKNYRVFEAIIHENNNK